METLGLVGSIVGSIMPWYKLVEPGHLFGFCPVCGDNSSQYCYTKYGPWFRRSGISPGFAQKAESQLLPHTSSVRICNLITLLGDLCALYSLRSTVLHGFKHKYVYCILAIIQRRDQGNRSGVRKTEEARAVIYLEDHCMGYTGGGNSLAMTKLLDIIHHCHKAQL